MRSPSRFLTPIVVLLYLALSICGCSGKSLDERIRGRWAEEKTQRTVEFSEGHLYAIVANGEQVEVGLWKVDQDEVVMTAHAGPHRGQVVRWRPKFHDDTFTVEKGEAFIRTFARLEAYDQMFDPRLVGLWRQDGESPEVVEFTPRATMLGWAWRMEAETKKPFVAGSWAKVSRDASDVFLLDGWFDNTQMSPARKHKYRYDGGKLVWTKPYGRGRDIVFRKVSIADLTLETIPTPSASPSP